MLRTVSLILLTISLSLGQMVDPYLMYGGGMGLYGAMNPYLYSSGLANYGAFNPANLLLNPYNMDIQSSMLSNYNLNGMGGMNNLNGMGGMNTMNNLNGLNTAAAYGSLNSALGTAIGANALGGYGSNNIVDSGSTLGDNRLNTLRNRLPVMGNSLTRLSGNSLFDCTGVLSSRPCLPKQRTIGAGNSVENEKATSPNLSLLQRLLLPNAKPARHRRFTFFGDEVKPPGNYCSNGGTFHRGKCQCRYPYAGDHCDDFACQNGLSTGSRYDPKSEFFNKKCICDEHWSGELCHIPIADQCNERGSYINGRCHCHGYYFGPACQYVGKCIHGTLKAGICECNYGFEGDYCELIVCYRGYVNKAKPFKKLYLSRALQRFFLRRVQNSRRSCLRVSKLHIE
ncbi:EGF-like domain-containing protein [Aphelenchoides bicaudatus]|nr:EGF-like domain-containing protein [Aphelenchoides bicaudatus]